MNTIFMVMSCIYLVCLILCFSYALYFRHIHNCSKIVDGRIIATTTYPNRLYLTKFIKKRDVQSKQFLVYKYICQGIVFVRHSRIAYVDADSYVDKYVSVYMCSKNSSKPYLMRDILFQESKLLDVFMYSLGVYFTFVLVWLIIALYLWLRSQGILV